MQVWIKRQICITNCTKEENKHTQKKPTHHDRMKAMFALTNSVRNDEWKKIIKKTASKIKEIAQKSIVCQVTIVHGRGWMKEEKKKIALPIYEN